jgi:hypothetical protein
MPWLQQAIFACHGCQGFHVLHCRDGTYQGVDLVIDRGGIQDMTLGQIFTATSTIQHVYKARKKSNEMPFTAYFMGGFRGYGLQSSAASRIRLETSVNIQTMKCAPASVVVRLLASKNARVHSIPNPMH